MSITRQPMVNKDVQYTYYHVQRGHIAGKNPTFAQSPVMFDTADVCQLFTADHVR